ncbi:MAG: hypothetical protein IIC54_12480 [Proteobacteria bacterium]|nr:hypothetical protein [Pseudomonadota bacterium]
MDSWSRVGPRDPRYFDVRRDMILELENLGRVDEAELYLRRAQRQHDRWADVLRRLPSSGLLPDDEAMLKRLEAAMTATD